jgi:hypothetical protein
MLPDSWQKGMKQDGMAGGDERKMGAIVEACSK